MQNRFVLCVNLWKELKVVCSGERRNVIAAVCEVVTFSFYFVPVLAIAENRDRKVTQIESCHLLAIKIYRQILLQRQ